MQIVGHEIMHGFDMKGIGYTTRGAVKYPKHPSSVADYTKKVLCLRSSYEEVEKERQFPGLDPKTDSEGFADWTGVQLAYGAFRSLPPAERDATVPGLSLDAEKLFFIAQCYKSCGSETKRSKGGNYWATRSRCVVPLRHMPEFARAFSCPKGSKMNPATRCSFFE
ncbi:hypothetical protein HPB48_020939 [Haemaphysalis longicornis]|uniref:Peptidase M13 C-terminal domain-containing protein n=1 Tax=Haemaphysalis longicornis TaxID=44386 RepID=A0A9J6G246_HAELO|nr:hypothetical protein HPB48_020939 [Haemaphysalis longicornis]